MVTSDATKVIPFWPSEKTNKKEMICGMAAATKVIPFLPSEKTDKKDMIYAMADATNPMCLFPASKTNVGNSCTTTAEMSRHGKHILEMSHRVMLGVLLLINKLLRGHIVLSMKCS